MDDFDLHHESSGKPLKDFQTCGIRMRLVFERTVPLRCGRTDRRGKLQMGENQRVLQWSRQEMVVTCQTRAIVMGVGGRRPILKDLGSNGMDLEMDWL